MANLIDRFRKAFGGDAKAKAAEAEAPKIRRHLRQSGRTYDSFAAMASAGLGLHRTEAMRTAVVWRCVNVISGAMSQLEWRVEGKPKAEADRLHNLINVEPTPMCGAAHWKEWIVRSTLIFGDQANWIRRTRNGDPVEIVPAVGISQIARKAGRRIYTLELPSRDGYGGTYTQAADQADVLHFTGPGHSPFTGRTDGLVNDVLKSSLDLQKAQEKFAHEFFDKPPQVRSVIFTDYDMTDDDQMTAMIEEWQRANSPEAAKYASPFVFSNQIREMQQLALNLSEAQLNEGRSFQIAEQIRGFGMPGFLANQADKGAWGPGFAETINNFFRFSIMPDVVRYENEFYRKFGPKMRVRIQTRDFTRATEKERYENHRKSLGSGTVPGFKTINEVREEEGLPPLEGEVYDKPYTGREAQRSKDEEPTFDNDDGKGEGEDGDESKGDEE